MRSGRTLGARLSGKKTSPSASRKSLVVESAYGQSSTSFLTNPCAHISPTSLTTSSRELPRAVDIGTHVSAAVATESSSKPTTSVFNVSHAQVYSCIGAELAGDADPSPLSNPVSYAIARAIPMMHDLQFASVQDFDRMLQEERDIQEELRWLDNPPSPPPSERD